MERELIIPKLLLNLSDGVVLSRHTQYCLFNHPERDFVWRVFAVTDSENSPHCGHFKLTTSAPSYCTPSIIIWLTEDGLEDPHSELLHVNIQRCYCDRYGTPPVSTSFAVEFSYDDGRYTGIMVPNSNICQWAFNVRCNYTLHNISSL